MSISIIKAGLLDTIQDLGRYGYGNWGVNPGGTMDRYAGQVANMLVGNCPEAAVLEIHFPAAQILFEQNSLIALTGADFAPMVNEESVPTWQPVVVRKNTVLYFPQLQWGGRCYLAVHGGFHIEKWLNSFATNLRTGAGGFQGRSLQKGDELTTFESTIYYAGWLQQGKNMRVLPWGVAAERVYTPPNEVYITKGYEWDDLTSASRQGLLQSNFTIHPSSDRMGYRLRGPMLELKENTDLVSSAVSFGTLQLLPGSELIALMADHQTTGGYPRVGHIISAHLPKFAQLRPGDTVHFNLIGLDKAEEMLFAQARELKIIQRSCSDHLKELLC